MTNPLSRRSQKQQTHNYNGGGLGNFYIELYPKLKRNQM